MFILTDIEDNAVHVCSQAAISRTYTIRHTGNKRELDVVSSSVRGHVPRKTWSGSMGENFEGESNFCAKSGDGCGRGDRENARDCPRQNWPELRGGGVNDPCFVPLLGVCVALLFM